jgi:hypothetical protein
LTGVYFLPLWFQGIKGTSPLQSGIRLFPTVIGMIIGAIAAGVATQKTGYYTPTILIGAPIMAIGAGLFTTFNVDTPSAKWIGYQVPFGIGLGAAVQAPLLAAQTVLSLADVPIGTALVYFSNNLGGAIFVSVAQNLFNNKLVSDLWGVLGVDSATILDKGATHLVDIAQPTRDIVIRAYNAALRKVFIVGVAVTGIVFVSALFMEWKSVKKQPPEGGLDNVEDDSDRIVPGTTTDVEGGSKSEAETSAAGTHKETDV